MLSLFSQNALGQVFSKLPEKERNAAIIKAAKEYYNDPAFKKKRKTWPYHGEPTVKLFYLTESQGQEHGVGTLQYEVQFWMKKTYSDGTHYGAGYVWVSDKLGKGWMVCFPDMWVWYPWNKYHLEKKNSKKSKKK